MTALPARVSLVVAALGALGGCSKHVPSNVAPLVESVKPDVLALAVEAAKACGDILKSGRMTVTANGCSLNVLPGETMVPELPSPAKGTALESNPDVVNVFVMCNASAAPNQSCGSGLGPLRPSPRFLPMDNGPRDPLDGTCRSSPTDCDEAFVPSRHVASADSVDLHVVKPVIGGPAGANAEVTVVLKKK